jgi:hypothetical protein
MSNKGFQTDVIGYMREHPDIDWIKPDSNRILREVFADHPDLAGLDNKAIQGKIRTAKGAGKNQLDLDEGDQVDVLGLSDGSLDAEVAANELDLSDDGLDDPDLTPDEIEQAVIINTRPAERKTGKQLTIDGKADTPAPNETKKAKSPGRPVKLKGELVKYGFQIEKDLLKQFKHTLIDRDESGADLIRGWIQEYVDGNR